MHPPISRTALKEWSVVVKALAKGEQILLLNETFGHGASDTHFFLYPAKEEAVGEHIKEPFQGLLLEAIEEDDTPGMVFFTYWAEVERAYRIDGIPDPDAISPYCIWTPEYLRSHGNREPDLLLVRVFELVQPQAVPILEEYANSGPWIELVEDMPVGDITPMLSDEEFEKRSEELHEALTAMGAAVRP